MCKDTYIQGMVPASVYSDMADKSRAQLSHTLSDPFKKKRDVRGQLKLQQQAHGTRGTIGGNCTTSSQGTRTKEKIEIILNRAFFDSNLLPSLPTFSRCFNLDHDGRQEGFGMEAYLS